MKRIGFLAILIWCVAIFGVNGKHSRKVHHKVHRPKIEVDISQYMSDNKIVGIDVSKHTGDINWDIIKRQGVGFAYIKSTEGADYLDPRFQYNIKEAKIAGVPVGAYHFFRFHRGGKEQADNFMSQVNLKELDLPPVVDVEEWGQYRHSKNIGIVTAEIQHFITDIETKTNRKVVIYSDQNTYRKYLEGRFLNNRIWICALGTAPKISQKWSLWQNCHSGRCTGTSGIVDINLFNGDTNDWQEFIQN